MKNNRILYIISLLLFVPMLSYSQTLTTDEIINALRTDLPGRGKRGLSLFGGEQKAPSVNLRIQFNYNKATLTDEARMTLIALGEALSSDALSGNNFEIIGHTDARGSTEYNQVLSEERAKTVVEWLCKKYDVERDKLAWHGEGESHLLDIDNPDSGENRRVEIRTILK